MLALVQLNRKECTPVLKIFVKPWKKQVSGMCIMNLRVPRTSGKRGEDRYGSLPGCSLKIKSLLVAIKNEPCE